MSSTHRLPSDALFECIELLAAHDDKHGGPQGDWTTRSPAYHAGKAIKHAGAWFVERVDRDSGRSHLVHAATRALMALALELRGG